MHSRAWPYRGPGLRGEEEKSGKIEEKLHPRPPAARRHPKKRNKKTALPNQTPATSLTRSHMKRNASNEVSHPEQCLSTLQTASPPPTLVQEWA